MQEDDAGAWRLVLAGAFAIGDAYAQGAPPPPLAGARRRSGRTGAAGGGRGRGAAEAGPIRRMPDGKPDLSGFLQRERARRELRPGGAPAARADAWRPGHRGRSAGRQAADAGVGESGAEEPSDTGARLRRPDGALRHGRRRAARLLCAVTVLHHADADACRRAVRAHGVAADSNRPEPEAPAGHRPAVAG